MEEEKIDPSIIWNIFIFTLIGLILGTSYMMYAEYAGARDSCLDREGEFEFKFPNKYYCDTMPYLKYNDGTWDWSREVNISVLNFP